MDGVALVRASALQALDRAGALLALGEAAGLMEARLAPGMWGFREQIACAAGFARRAVLPLTGAEVGEVDVPHDAESLRARIASARADVEAADGPVPFEVVHRAGFADLQQTPLDYPARFALPNLWFHLSMAYAILRANGVDVGKAEFDGLHEYPDGFRWE